MTIPSQNEQSYFAFKYATTISWLDVRFDNLYVKNFSTVGLRTLQKSDVLIKTFPNPSRGSVQFYTSSDHLKNELLNLSVFDALGRLLFAKTISLEESVDLNLEIGIYVYRLSHIDSQLLQTGKIFLNRDQ